MFFSRWNGYLLSVCYTRILEEPQKTHRDRFPRRGKFHWRTKKNTNFWKKFAMKTSKTNGYSHVNLFTSIRLFHKLCTRSELGVIHALCFLTNRRFIIQFVIKALSVFIYPTGRINTIHTQLWTIKLYALSRSNDVCNSKKIYYKYLKIVRKRIIYSIYIINARIV